MYILLQYASNNNIFQIEYFKICCQDRLELLCVVSLSYMKNMNTYLFQMSALIRFCQPKTILVLSSRFVQQALVFEPMNIIFLVNWKLEKSCFKAFHSKYLSFIPHGTFETLYPVSLCWSNMIQFARLSLYKMILFRH